MELAAYRSENRVSLASLAERCGVTPSTVAKWERFAVFPRPGQLRALEVATGGAVTPAEMVAGYCRAHPPPEPQAAVS